MKLHCLHQACAVALFAVAPLVAAQAPAPQAATSGTNASASATSGNQSTMSTKGSGKAQATTPAGTTTAQGGASAETGAPQGSAMSHDMDSTHAMKAHKRHAHASGNPSHAASHPDTPYHGALKRCAEGPADQRDSCIDQAIRQYGT
jgi:hypothetical protein